MSNVAQYSGQYLTLKMSLINKSFFDEIIPRVFDHLNSKKGWTFKAHISLANKFISKLIPHLPDHVK